MKHLMIAIVAFFMSLNVFAGGKLESGSVAPLAKVNKANFEVEFVSIHGMSEADFSKYETDWYTDKSEVLGRILENANKKLKGTLAMGNNPSAEYTVKLVVNEISKKGDYSCVIKVLDANKKEIAKIVDVKAKGGTWGSKLNLIKDGAEGIGKEFGSILKSEVKKAK